MNDTLTNNFSIFHCIVHAVKLGQTHLTMAISTAFTADVPMAIFTIFQIRRMPLQITYFTLPRTLPTVMRLFVAILAGEIIAMVAFLHTTVKDSMTSNTSIFTPIVAPTKTMPFITTPIVCKWTSCSIMISPERVPPIITTNTSTLAKFLTRLFAHY